MTENNQSHKEEEKENAEIHLLLQCTVANLEFFKNRQWHIFVFYSAIAAFLITQAKDMEIITKTCISIALSIGTLIAPYMLNHYQKKMSIERKVLKNIYENFGTKFNECRKPKGDVEKPDTFEGWFVWLGYAYFIVTFFFVMITFWYKYIC